MSDKKVNINLRISIEMRDALRKQAQDNKRNMTQQVIYFLRQYLTDTAQASGWIDY